MRTFSLVRIGVVHYEFLDEERWAHEWCIQRTVSELRAAESRSSTVHNALVTVSKDTGGLCSKISCVALYLVLR